MLYAIAKIGSKQYKVTENKEFTVDRLPNKVGQTVAINDVLMVVRDDKKLIGRDAKKVKIKAKVTEELLGDKVLVFKHKKRKRYNKLVGHRQRLSKIIIEKIDFEGKKKEQTVGSKQQIAKKNKVTAEGSHPACPPSPKSNSNGRREQSEGSKVKETKTKTPAKKEAKLKETKVKTVANKSDSKVKTSKKTK